MLIEANALPLSQTANHGNAAQEVGDDWQSIVTMVDVECSFSKYGSVLSLLRQSVKKLVTTGRA